MFLVSHNQIHYSKDSDWGEIIHYQLKEAATLTGPEPAWEGQVYTCQEVLSSGRWMSEIDLGTLSMIKGPKFAQQFKFDHTLLYMLLYITLALIMEVENCDDFLMCVFIFVNEEIQM